MESQLFVTNVHKFNNIYIEKRTFDYPLTRQILLKFPNANIIEIDHYKDVFCRPKQNVLIQKENQSLILAVKKNNFIYPGSGLCQDFDFDNFYYSSCIMNCVCNCEYCYLKGMYPSGHIVAFVNLDDYFKYIKNKNIYICASYDTDFFPLESTFGYVKKWLDFARKEKNLKIEIRTKCKNLNVWNYKPTDNVIFAFSLSPQNIIDNFEHKTSSLDARLENIRAAQDNDFVTRLCFDPIIYCDNWRNEYSTLIEKTFERVDPKKIQDISIGSFRISQTYLKNMRKNDSRSKIVNFPFKNIDSVYQYDAEVQNDMENFVYNLVTENFDRKRVFLWK